MANLSWRLATRFAVPPWALVPGKREEVGKVECFSLNWALAMADDRMDVQLVIPADRGGVGNPFRKQRMLEAHLVVIAMALGAAACRRCAENVEARQQIGLEFGVRDQGLKSVRGPFDQQLVDIKVGQDGSMAEDALECDLVKRRLQEIGISGPAYSALASRTEGKWRLNDYAQHGRTMDIDIPRESVCIGVGGSIVKEKEGLETMLPVVVSYPVNNPGRKVVAGQCHEAAAAAHQV